MNAKSIGKKVLYGEPERNWMLFRDAMHRYAARLGLPPQAVAAALPPEFHEAAAAALCADAAATVPGRHGPRQVLTPLPPGGPVMN